MSKALLEAIAVTAELTNTQLSEVAAKVMASDFGQYPEQQVLGALTRCRRELKGRLTIADVMTRLEDGRPGPEEAWAMLPRDEAATVVWTEEMRMAWGIALPLLDVGEDIPARMAFKESYTKLVQEAREHRIRVCWTVSLGHDKHERVAVLMDAVEQGRLSAPQVSGLLPYHEITPELQRVLSKLEPVKMLEAQ